MSKSAPLSTNESFPLSSTTHRLDAQFNPPKTTKPNMTSPGNPPVIPDPIDPFTNLAAVTTRLDSLSRFLRDSVNSNTPLPPHQRDSVNSELTSAVHDAIAAASSLLSSAVHPAGGPSPISCPARPAGTGAREIVEVGAEELLAEQVHVCEVCGKGFRRDANLRMHMRAHGDQYKTPQALAKPVAAPVDPHVHVGSCTGNIANNNTERLFSCPFVGCNRNKDSLDFRPMKSALCVKNHFKRTHRPRTYACDRCNKKSFSVVGDLRNHMKSCRVNEKEKKDKKWKCNCGSSFGSKDKLFAHVALFEGHMPSIHPSSTMLSSSQTTMLVEDKTVDYLDSATRPSASGDGSMGDLDFLIDDDIYGFLD